MAQKLVSPKSEPELRKLLDFLYAESKAAIDKGEKPSFKGLLEVISAETTIVSAIHNIKANRGSRTAGSDNETMQRDILEKDYHDVINRVQNALKDYHPNPVRRVYIPKPGKEEKRPLGIPAVIDRIIQECVRIVLEPILEAQFHPHSYGFRPMRSAQMAIERVIDLVHKTGHYWIVEGDISKYFDTITHTILLKKLYHMGIKDQRVLMVIKQMLKAGIMGEIVTNPMGTPQGGVLSPLLANAYLHTFDEWITNQWENKKTRHTYNSIWDKRRWLRKRSNLKPAYLIRYADDWVLITNSKRNAERWKWKTKQFLKDVLKLELSIEKTVVTDVRKKVIQFLGFEYKVRKCKSTKKGYVPNSRPNKDRIKAKVKEIHTYAKTLKRATDNISLLRSIDMLNSKIRGVIQYYQTATGVNKALSKYGDILVYAGYKAIKRRGGKWTPANQTYNLHSVHSQYKSQIPAIEINGLMIGITSLKFCRFRYEPLKNQDETPYSPEGRKLYMERAEKKPLLARAEELYSDLVSYKIALYQSDSGIYNFEYYMNRAYAFNRDRGKCRVCGGNVASQDVHIHHKNNKLPLSEINKVPNLVTTHVECHKLIHNYSELSKFGKTILKKVQGFRNSLGN